MAATWVSKIGYGKGPIRCQTISISWRAAWKTFSTYSSAIKFEQKLQVDALGQGVDDDRFLGARHLHDAEQGIIGRLAQEFRIDRDYRVLGEARGNGCEFRGGGNQIHEQSITLPKQAFCRKR